MKLEKDILEVLFSFHVLKVGEITSYLNRWKGYELDNHQVRYRLHKLEKDGKVKRGYLNSRLYQLVD